MNTLWRDFYRWLDRATVAQLFAARDAAYEQRRQVRDPDLRRDLRRMIRLLDEELLTRSDLAEALRREAARDG